MAPAHMISSRSSVGPTLKRSKSFHEDYPAYMSPLGCVAPIFPHAHRISHPKAGELFKTSEMASDRLAFHPSTLHCVHVPLAASDKWRKRLIPDCEDGDPWVCPRVTIRPNGRPGNMLLSACTKDVDGTPQVYEGVAELKMVSRSDPRRMKLVPKDSVASHVKSEHYPRMTDSVQSIASTRSSRLSLIGSWIKGEREEANKKVPFNIRYYSIDPETGYVQNLVVTGDDDGDALILTRLRKALYRDGEAARVLQDIVRSCRGEVAINPALLDYSMVEEATLRAASWSSPTSNGGLLTAALQEDWHVRRQYVTESFRQCMRHSLRQSLADFDIQKPVAV